MLKRSLTSLVIMALLIGSFALRFVSPYFFDAMIGVIVVMSAYEVCEVFIKNNRKNDIYFVVSYGILIYLSLILSIKTHKNLAIYFATILGVFALVLLAMFIINKCSKNKNNKEMIDCKFNGNYNQYVGKKVGLDAFLLMYPVFLLSILFALNHLSEFSYFANSNAKGIEFLMLVLTFATTIMTDTGAYLVGSALKGKKLCPTISPNKTISGAIGGLVCSIATSLALFAIFGAVTEYSAMFNAYNINIIAFAVYGIVSSVASQFGDIFASFVKRQNGVKDYGNIFPGHGGFMDRVDGISFNAVISLVFAIFLFI